MAPRYDLDPIFLLILFFGFILSHPTMLVFAKPLEATILKRNDVKEDGFKLSLPSGMLVFRQPGPQAIFPGRDGIKQYVCYAQNVHWIFY